RLVSRPRWSGAIHRQAGFVPKSRQHLRGRLSCGRERLEPARRSRPGQTDEGSRVPASERAIELALTAAQAAADKKAEDIVILDVADQLVITDAFLVASAPNERQGLSIVRAHGDGTTQLPE